ncbi:MAG: hypothetical protein PHR92_00750 [Lachnospiraceae bacterium]|nr:hypothetical protein [Lachnospiraceae bacterium]
MSKSVVYAENDNEEEFDIGLTGKYEWDDCKLLLNGEEVSYIKGKDFISFNIPQYLRVKGEKIQVSLFSEAACGEAEKMSIKVK